MLTGPDPRLAGLTAANVRLVRDCLDLVARTSLVEDWEFQTLLGLERMELVKLCEAVLATGRVTTIEQAHAAVNAGALLCGYPFDEDERAQIVAKLGEDYRAAIEAFVRRVHEALDDD